MSRRPIDFKMFRDLVSPLTVLEWIGWQSIRWAGRNAVGPCPLCGDNSWKRGCMLVGTRVAKCLRCGWFGDALALHSALTHHPVYESAVDLADKLRIEVPYIDAPRRAT